MNKNCRITFFRRTLHPCRLTVNGVPWWSDYYGDFPAKRTTLSEPIMTQDSNSGERHFSYSDGTFGFRIRIVLELLVSKGSRSTDENVRATCSSALGMLLKSTNLLSWRADRLDHTDSGRSSIDSESSSRR